MSNLEFCTRSFIHCSTIKFFILRYIFLFYIQMIIYNFLVFFNLLKEGGL